MPTLYNMKIRQIARDINHDYAFDNIVLSMLRLKWRSSSGTSSNKRKDRCTTGC